MSKGIWLLAAVMMLPAACIKMKHEMVIQPVHITVDVRIRIDRELEDFFGEIDKAKVPAESGDVSKQEGVK
ncbi:MAG: hypothetical protein PHX05_09605 [Acidobacteriota bacterium]|nr:hypothetical protein [Acidobacteriota bacterium]